MACPSALVIIPTYNEIENIAEAIAQVMAQPGDIDILVVDDNSPDGTASEICRLQEIYGRRLALAERSGKLGLGTAYLHGFRYALERDYTFVCEMDADLSHNPDDIPRLMAAVEHSGADLAIGSRYVGGVRVIDWPLTRLMLSYGAGVYTRLVTGLPVQDVTAGFVCYHRRVLEQLDFNRIRSNGYSFQVEMKYRTWKQGCKLTEVPIIFTERTEGRSKMNRAIVWEAAFKVWELRLRAIFGNL